MTSGGCDAEEIIVTRPAFEGAIRFNGDRRRADLRPCAEVALDAFGPARLMFGSDWPVCTLAASYPDVLRAADDLTAGLSPAERAAVFAGTATSVYGL